ncbi:hypothetical protein AT1G76994 [Arabidopsis thaliana]|uniref:Uncharacterized protein n=2 Tax=Arabidopsis thaliana TaxID=3702 RepID=B3H504_ARATH|nr:uncharacterized protein AT1G76994 [Arabidopsis thaliana]AEE35922.1 hypothetical protein AT1G76994 [Arabidopsis thaliana]CAA0338817.1 unnamed protein product [Arabidopsis thaliana]|eukprot:NP_001117609.1 hypothetical protein AT1G76994 [Arabidopsis thaliana]
MIKTVEECFIRIPNLLPVRPLVFKNRLQVQEATPSSAPEPDTRFILDHRVLTC